VVHNASIVIQSAPDVISYVVAALPEPSLCLQAANALRDLCDANRVALAPHISAIWRASRRLGWRTRYREAKVLQSIASVIQALPPEEEIPPIEVGSSIVHGLGSDSYLERRLSAPW